jgi:site-specific DNA-cytosine methylase
LARSTIGRGLAELRGTAAPAAAPGRVRRKGGFNDEDQRYAFSGTKTDVIKQIGNAAPVGTTSALVGALFRER